MKKNKMMRIASFLLVAVLMSTCAISGTFAKYVTANTATDSARVAKWGITMDADGAQTFVTTYDSTVASSDKNDVVAPGTKGADTFKVEGKPETDYVVSFSHASTGVVTESDIFLKITDDVTPSDVTLYYPLDWSVTLADHDGNEFAGTIGGTITELGTTTYATLQEALAALAGTTVTYDANKACDIAVTIAWEWDFDGTTNGGIGITEDTYKSNSTYDTILGDFAAGLTPTITGKTINKSLNVAYNLTITATQIDD